MKTNNLIDEASAPANKPAKVHRTIHLSKCWFEWQDEAGNKLADNYVHNRGDVYATVMTSLEGERAIIFKEARMYCHIDDAWKILVEGHDYLAVWKDSAMLLTLRQALRERFVQNMPLEIPKGGIGERALKQWLAIARHHDAVHHGRETF